MAKTAKILVVVDPRAKEHPAAIRGMDIARRLGLRLELMSCLHWKQSVATSAGIDAGSARRAMLCAQLEKLRRLADSCPDLDIETRVVWDRPPYEAIIREILRGEPRLVLKDSPYHPAVSRGLLTNTDWQLIRDCPAPLWLVRTAVQWPAAPRIAAFVNPSAGSARPDMDHRILDEATELGRGLSAEIHAINCHDSEALPADFCAPCAGIDAAVLNAESQAEQSCSLRDLASSHGIANARIHMRRGQPVDLIPRIAEEMDIHLAVMGAINHSRLRQAFISSTAEQVLDRLGCDVLVLKPARFESAVTYRAQASDFMEMSELPDR